MIPAAWHESCGIQPGIHVEPGMHHMQHDNQECSQTHALTRQKNRAHLSPIWPWVLAGIVVCMRSPLCRKHAVCVCVTDTRSQRDPAKDMLRNGGLGTGRGCPSTTYNLKYIRTNAQGDDQFHQIMRIQRHSAEDWLVRVERTCLNLNTPSGLASILTTFSKHSDRSLKRSPRVKWKRYMMLPPQRISKVPA